MYVYVLYAFLTPIEVRRRHQIPWDWCYGQLWAFPSVLGTDFRFSEIATSALNHQARYQVPEVEFEGLRWVYLCLVHIHSLAPRPCHWEGNLRGRQAELIEPHSAEGQRKLRGFSKLADGDFRWSSWEPTLSTRSSVSTMLQGQTSYKLSFLERAGRVLIEMIYNFLFMLSDQDWPFDSKCHNTLSFQLLSWENRFKAPPLSKAPRAFGLDHFETSFSISFIHVVPKEAECGVHSHARTRKIFGTWSKPVTCGFLQCP